MKSQEEESKERYEDETNKVTEEDTTATKRDVTVVNHVEALDLQ